MNRRHPDKAKISKLVEWLVPISKKELRLFVGLAVYFRILIKHFQILIAPLYNLLRKNVRFQWSVKHQLVFDNIKMRLSTFPAVLPIDYSFAPLTIIIAVDISIRG